MRNSFDPLLKLCNSEFVNTIRSKKLSRNELLILQDSARIARKFDKQLLVTTFLLESYPEDVGCLQAHVIGLINSKLYNQALECARICYLIDKKNFRSQNNYFEILFLLGQYDTANSIADEMIHVHSTNQYAYIHKLRLLKKLAIIKTFLRLLPTQLLLTIYVPPFF